MTSILEKQGKERYALAKKLNTLKRELWAIHDTLSQEEKDPLEKVKIQHQYFVQQHEKREKFIENERTLLETKLQSCETKCDEEIREYEVKKQTYSDKIAAQIAELQAKQQAYIEKTDAHISALKIAKESKVNELTRKLENYENDNTLAYLQSEIVRVGEKLGKDRCKTMREIRLEAEIKEVERLLRFTDNEMKETQENLAYLQTALAPVVKVATELTGEQYRQQSERYYLELDKQIEENQKLEREKTSQTIPQNTIVYIQPSEQPTTVILKSTVTVVYDGETVDIDEATKRVEMLAYQERLLKEKEKQAQEERKNQQRERLQAKRKELLQKASCASTTKEKNDLEFEARHLRLVDF